MMYRRLKVEPPFTHSKSGQIVHSPLLSPFDKSDILEYRWIRHRTKPCKFSFVDFTSFVFRIILEE